MSAFFETGSIILEFVVGGLTNALTFMSSSWQSVSQLLLFCPSIIYSAFIILCIVGVSRFVVSLL